MAVVLATGHHETELARSVSKANRITVLQKPFVPEALLTTLKQLGI
jgi:FixJ family two-component response regulator